ncbi:hypothetical protein LOC68_16140 [Blastopirellula sp. JC732]|uniref:Type II/III secretion system secretin-like domain-containing protein n=1 Tax=Blastopirellula sediminis TaxID=2894196 RepID=A0A9X1SHA0_9BACT|nr:hypothetical protein [Blastopirellula sediminis]MCC9606781.1 hypothetical protein [Blastopirellula sediminis]MCC9629922.1 hypothetical protein [Blastopirellula sediminis]
MTSRLALLLLLAISSALQAGDDPPQSNSPDSAPGKQTAAPLADPPGKGSGLSQIPSQYEQGYVEVPRDENAAPSGRIKQYIPPRPDMPEPQPSKTPDVNVQNGTVQFGIVQYGPPQSSAVQQHGTLESQFNGMPGVGPFPGMVTPPMPPMPPRMVRVRVALLEAEGKVKSPHEPLIPVEEMLEMINNGEKFDVIDSFDLTTVTGHETKVQQGRREPVVTGTQIVPQRGPDGRATAARANSYSQQNVGTLLTVAPQIMGHRALLKVNFERSDIAYPDDDDDDEEEDDDDEEESPQVAGAPPSTTTMTIDTAVLLESGQATILSTRDSHGERHLLLIGVEILDAGEEPGQGGGGQMGGFF